jgi:adenosylcobinamide kinase/adenosylcobinamide-phosphate guanylyltransferase
MEMLAQEFSQSKHVFIVVSNEVGMSLIPPTKIGRIFSDIQGATNQMFARNAKDAYLIVSGLEIKLK